MRTSQKGFTLVEMAIVLVIIGVILASVMVGRDVQRNSEYIKIRQTFINQWVVAYNTYWQRMGGPFGDNLLNRTLMVNGANFTGTYGNNMSEQPPPRALCFNNAAHEKNEREAQQEPPFNLRTIMLEAGIDLPEGRGRGLEDRYAYQDSNGNPQELQICFQWNPPGTLSGSGNMMVISGLTPDLARALAVGIKGVSNATTGNFRQQGITLGADDEGAGDAATTRSAYDWSYHNTMLHTSTETSANGGSTEGMNRDSQVETVVAYYRMNQ